MEIGAAVGGIVFLLVLLSLWVFWVWALVDAARVEDDSSFRTGNKLTWVVVMALTHVVGSLVYFFVGRPRSA